MAAITWYLTNNSVSVGSDLSETDPGAEAYRSPVTGWIVSTGATNHSPWANDVEQAAATFADTTQPDGTLDTTNGDFWVSPSTYRGTFANANWNVHLAARANTNGGAADGRMRCRLFRGPNQNGTSATEITAAQQSGGLVTDLGTAATQVSTATFNPGSFSVTDEYLFVQIAWERTGAGGMSTSDVNARIGGASSSRVVTADFAPTHSGTGAITVPAATVAGSGSEVFTATGAVVVPSASVAGTGAEVFTATGAVSVPTVTVAGVGDHAAAADPSGTGAISVPAATVAGTGSLVLTGTGAITGQAPTVSGVGAEVFTATGAIAVPSATVAGSGSHSVGGASHTATGAISVSAATVAGTGNLALSGNTAPIPGVAYDLSP